MSVADELVSDVDAVAQAMETSTRGITVQGLARRLGWHREGVPRGRGYESADERRVMAALLALETAGRVFRRNAARHQRWRLCS